MYTELEMTQLDQYISAKTYHLHMEHHFYMKYHFHEYIELVYLLKGSLKAYIDGKCKYVRQEELILIQPQSIHRFELLENCEMITMLLSYEDLSHYDARLNYKSFQLDQDESHHLALKTLMQAIDKNRKSDDLYRNILVQKDIYQIFYILLTYMCQEHDEPIYNDYQDVNCIIDYIEEHYHEPISYQQVSHIFGYSQSYLCRYFKKRTGMSMLQFQRMIQLKRAYLDVCYSQEDMNHIAYTHGFSSTQSFIKIFKAEYQTTPYVYRKQLGQK